MTDLAISELRIVKMGIIDEARLTFERNKVLLFGPNGAGKSTAILALEALLSQITNANIVIFDKITPYIREGFTVEAVINGAKYGLMASDHISYVEKDGIRRPAPTLYFSLAGAAHVAPCKLTLVKTSSQIPPPVYDLCEGNISVDEPEVGKWIADNIYLIGGRDFYYDSVLYDEWLEISQLAYGHRRALGIIMAAFNTDFVAIEAFEAGMHYDLAVELIHWLSYRPQFVIAETHLALAAKAALSEKWDVYYVEAGVFHKVSDFKELRKYAFREMTAYAASQ